MFETGDGASPAEAIALERGLTLSRYLLVERVGVGGMGVVWAAYDPELDRKIAIKLLRPRNNRGRSELARTRLIREAQVMARINHPNVIAVHDVGEHDGQVFLAMEFVHGKTLGRWVRTTRRDWRALVKMFVQAGRGLAAAHRVGLVHRDFKPTNVLIDADARARVLDFGLARSVEGPRTERDEVKSWSASRIQKLRQDPIVTPLTRTGSMLGTPAYMAPEQFEGHSFDARADQFAFCVALWEALYHRRPFSGATIEELSAAVCSGTVDPPTSDMRLPSFIERALRRGLAVDPVERWPSMDALLTELSRDPVSGRRRWFVVGALSASFLAALIVSPLLDEQPSETSERVGCPESRAVLDELWPAAARQELGLAVLGSGVQTPGRWTSMAAALDGYASDYAAMRVDTCEAVHAGRLPEPSARDRCLDDRRRAFVRTVDLLGGGDRKLIAGAPVLLAALPSIAACEQDRYIAGLYGSEDPKIADAGERLRSRMLAAHTRAELGAVDRARADLHELEREAGALTNSRLDVAILIELGFVEQRGGSFETARAQLERAVAEAIRGGYDELAARAATLLIDVVGRDLDDPEAGLRWADRAAAWNDRIDAPAIARAQRKVAEAELHRALGDFERATGAEHAALELLGVSELSLERARVDFARGRVAARALAGLARISIARAKLGDARAQLAALHELRLASFGPEHPKTMGVAIERALVEVDLGDWLAAAEWFSVGLPSARTRPSTGGDGHELAAFERARFRLSRAELIPAELEDAEVLLIAATDTIRLASSEDLLRDRATLELARLARLRGRFDAAEGLLASLTDVEPLRAAIALERGEVRLAESDPKRALVEFERAAIELGRLRGPAAAQAAAGQGRALALLGRTEQAKLALEQALAIWDELAPAGHPRSLASLDLLAELAGPDAGHRRRAEVIRASIL